MIKITDSGIFYCDCGNLFFQLRHCKHPCEDIYIMECGACRCSARFLIRNGSFTSISPFMLREALLEAE